MVLNMDDIEELLTYKDVARITLFHLSTIKKWANDGTLPPPVKIGRWRRYEKETIRKWIAERKKGES